MHKITRKASIKVEKQKIDAIYRDKRNKRMVQSPIHASKTSIHRGIDAFYQIAEKPKHQKSEKLALLMQRAR